MTQRMGYADIADHYRRRILGGDLAPGDAMPTVNAAADEHGVARNTAVRAYEVLKREGLVTTRAGAGTVVTHRPRVAPATGAARVARTRRGGPNYEPGETSSGHSASVAPCPDNGVTRDLELPPHARVVIRRRVFRRDGRPVVLGMSYAHPRALDVVPMIAAQGPLPRRWHEVYEETTGRTISGSPEMRAARHAEPDELAALEVDAPEGAAVPVLITRTVWHDEDGPIEVYEDIHAPDLWHVARD